MKYRQDASLKLAVHLASRQATLDARPQPNFEEMPETEYLGGTSLEFSVRFGIFEHPPWPPPTPLFMLTRSQTKEGEVLYQWVPMNK